MHALLSSLYSPHRVDVNTKLIPYPGDNPPHTGDTQKINAFRHPITSLIALVASYAACHDQMRELK